MKNFAAVALSALVGTGCVLPVAGPVAYSEPPIHTRAEIGSYPPPFIYSQPVVVAPPRFGPALPPVYLQVPPDHHQHWHQHCGRYRACDRPVYFVREPGLRPPPGYRVAPAQPVSESPRWQDPERRSWTPRPGHGSGRNRDRDRSDDGHHGWQRQDDRGGRMPGSRPLTQGDPRTR